MFSRLFLIMKKTFAVRVHRSASAPCFVSFISRLHIIHTGAAPSSYNLFDASLICFETKKSMTFFVFKWHCWKIGLTFNNSCAYVVSFHVKTTVWCCH